MKNIADKEKFIELRARGLSFAKISEEIGVSKPVLIKWNNELKKELQNRKFFVAEELLEKYHLMKVHRIEIFTKLLNKSLKELETRDFQSCSTKELINMVQFFDTQLKSEALSIKCITENIEFEFAEGVETVKIPLVD
ncbi:MAG: hypothetical protein ACFFG0_17465 [Candidatus Thorarchaeota archaeon]